MRIGLPSNLTFYLQDMQMNKNENWLAGFTLTGGKS